MPDRKQVIYDIERCICHVPDACRDCSKCGTAGAHCMEDLMTDALALLREQDTVGHALEVLKAHGWKDSAEAVEPNKPGTAYPTTWSCGVCTYPLSPDWVACPSCGKAVKWDA